MWIGLGWLLFTIAHASGEAEEAELSFQLGTRAYREGDYERALGEFLESNRLAPNPAVAFNIARCYAALERYAEAYRWFLRAEDGLPSEAVQRAIESELAKIVPQVVVYQVTSDPPGATVYAGRKDLGAIGTAPLTVALLPQQGERTFLFEHPGYEDVRVAVAGGGRGRTVRVEGALPQILGTAMLVAPEGTVVHQGSPDGPELCVAPCEARVPPGNRILYFRKEGFEDAVAQLEVGDTPVRATVQLQPLVGTLVVDAHQRGAVVEIDGVAVGITPVLSSAVPVGEHLVRISLPGYEPIERTVTIEAGTETAIADIELLLLDEVTAVSRRAEPVELAPSSVTIISSQELSAFRYPTVYEALRGVRGIAVSYDSIYGAVNLRGLGQTNDYNQRLLVLQDGATLNDDILAQGYIGYDARVDLGGVERIEVVRGPGSVLYGTGAMTGVVNLVMASPEAADGTQFAVGAFDQSGLRGHVLAKYDLGKHAGFRAEIAAATSGGRSETIEPLGGDAPLSVQAFDKFTAATTTGRLWMGDVSLQWLHNTRAVTVPTGAFFANLDDADHVWVDTRTMIEVKADPQVSQSTTISARTFFNRYQYDVTLPFGRVRSKETYSSFSGGAEARVAVEAGDRARFTLGGLGQTVPKVHLLGQDYGEKGVAALDDPYIDETFSYNIGAGYALFDFAPIDTIRLSLGGRLDYWSSTGTLAPSPRLTAVLLPSQRDFVKIVTGRAFRAPSIYELKYDSAVQVAPETLAPETADSAEIEYTHQFPRAWALTFAGYGTLARNFVESTLASEVGPIRTDIDPYAITLVNSDQVIRSVGADAEVRRSFVRGWMASAFYGFVDARYAQPGADPLVPNVPHHQAGVKLIMPLYGPIARVAFRTTLEAPRRISLADEETTDLALITDLVLSGSVPERKFEYSVGLYNLFDQTYAQPAGDTFPLRTIPQQGRSLLVNLAIGF